MHRNLTPARRAYVAVLVLLLAPMLMFARPARAATFTVNTNVDSSDQNPGNGVCADSSARCSLRAAIEESNARAGTDTVQVPANTYTLTDQLVIRDSLLLTGAGKDLTILSGNNAVEVLQVRTVELLVCDSGNDSIASYDPNGERNVDFLGAGAGGMDVPGSIAIGPENDVFVTAFSSGVHRFSLTGAPEGLFVDPADFPAGTFGPSVGVFGDFPEAPNLDLYVAEYLGSRVLRVDRLSGADSGFVASGSGGLAQPSDLAWHDDDLFVSSTGSNQVLRYDGANGSFAGVFVPQAPSGLSRPRGLEFHNGFLYVANEDTDSVLKYNAANGSFQGTFVAGGSGGLDRPSSLAFGPDGNLYVINRGAQNILRYNGQTGAFIDVFVQGGDLFLDNPACLFWRTGAGAGPIVNISGLTIQNGKTRQPGGPTSGLDVNRGASVSLRDAAVRNNVSSQFGGGIQNWGNLDLIDVEVSNNSLPEGGGGQTSQGGGIFNTGNLSVQRSLIADNFATRGGGISNTNEGRVELTSTTVSTNRAIGAGGGVRNVANGIVNISSSTITLNRANEPGGLGGEPTPFGGGIFTDGEARVNMANTILAGNTDRRTRFDAGFSPDCYSPTAFRFTSHRDNLVGILTPNCILRDTTWGDTRFDQVGSPTAPLDAALFSLANNGGPTRTHALAASSPAVDRDTAVTSASFFDCPATDQRGNPRPQGAACDVGAYERSQSTISAPEGASSSMSALPRFAGEAGVAARLTNNTPGSGAATLAFASVERNPTAVDLRPPGGRFVMLDLDGADAGDVLEATLYYPSTVDGPTESAADFRLLYFNGVSWLPVRGSAGAAPAKATADNANGSISGGSFSVRFDATSSPRVSDLRDTAFAAALRGPGATFLPLAAR